ncbi:Pyridoxal phosphate phosphatase PHOSPHO2 [Choanephora cucurbitarum]|uniref:Pyridoxal phosphate phosphatase PHOSPHO2 n=1 Tax=Choanephora cucurbitarum TaxID=101091 RepID=A0A1C7NCZ9_9FUNG|nr:Pyridoxal phosphate phosphatase PHOSPHO2 [Choanephora cucurbitarum]
MMKGIAVFDFDWSLIEQDSDYWAIHTLSPEVWQEVREKRETYQWTDLMDHALCRLQEIGFTKADVVNALKTIPFTDEMRRVLLKLKNENVSVILLSDANTFYIETIMEAYGVRDCITEIITNPACEDEQGRLRVRRYIQPSNAQHNCTNPCSVNICKGKELEKVIERFGGINGINKIAYIGDGKNDFCPATRLRNTDVFYMREKKGLGRYFEQMPQERQRITSPVVSWTHPLTVLEHITTYYSS